MKTLKDLTPGTVIRFNDIANVDLDFVVLNTTETNWGTYTDVLNKETNNIEPMRATTEMTGKWEILTA